MIHQQRVYKKSVLQKTPQSTILCSQTSQTWSREPSFLLGEIRPAGPGKHHCSKVLDHLWTIELSCVEFECLLVGCLFQAFEMFVVVVIGVQSGDTEAQNH